MTEPLTRKYNTIV